MIDRYRRPKMAQLWLPESRFYFMLQVEKAVAEVQGELGLIPKSSAVKIVKNARFSYKNILKREEISKHDVTAFVDEVSSHLGSAGAWFHYGLTSSDVLDTALSLQIQAAGQRILTEGLKPLTKSLKGLALKHKKTLCAGRTHGRHAEPSTFGFKLLGHLAEFLRAEKSLQQALKENQIGKLSGAVGVYAALPPLLEQRLCQKLSLWPETLATQVVPRDRLARLIFALALVGAAIERLAVELRHLQRTEVAEVLEFFHQGQRGSSAMPHKKNPISAENLTGLARLLRSYVAPALENISLWHERDISHSSVERVILPDAFILLDYALDRLHSLLKSLLVRREKMRENMALSKGLLYSSRLLNALVKKGLSRQKAYPLVQAVSQRLGGANNSSRDQTKDHTGHQAKNQAGLQLMTLLEKEDWIKKHLSPKELKAIFLDEEKTLSNLLEHFEKTLKSIKL